MCWSRIWRYWDASVGEKYRSKKKIHVFNVCRGFKGFLRIPVRAMYNFVCHDIGSDTRHFNTTHTSHDMRSTRRHLNPETLYRANIAKLLCFMLHFYFIENTKHDIRYTTCEATHGTTHDMRIDTQHNIAQMSWSCRVFTGVLVILINHTMKK